MGINDCYAANPPWWCQQCIANANVLGLKLCDQNHCDNTTIVKYSEAYCKCCQPFIPKPCTSSQPYPCNPNPQGCCPYDYTTPVPVLSEGCACCCGCFANHTPIAFEKDMYKEIQNYEIGDLVYVADDIELKSWSQRQVRFSSGTGDGGGGNPMIKVIFGNAERQDYLLVNRTQLFLVPGAKLKPAAALVPGNDSLVAQNGTAQPVLALEVGTYKQGMHHIATSRGTTTSPGGHLLVAKGIVVGDWALQVSLSSPSARAGLPLVKGFEDLLEFGTREYTAAHSHLDVTQHRAAVKGLAALELTPEQLAEFAPFDQINSAYIPENAFAFLTPDQAYDIAAYCPMASPSSNRGKSIMLYMFQLFGTFYPDFEFYFDEQNLTPNAYLFEAYGKQQVVFTGALGRCMPLQFEGLAAILATLVGATTGGPPQNQEGQSCLGVAGYAAIVGVVPNVWLPTQAVPVIKSGISQLKEFLNYIPQKDRGGSDTCMNISTDCLIASMNAAFVLAPLPECAGGPPDPALEVNGASGIVGLPHGTVTVNFNLPVDPKTASQLANYAIETKDSPLPVRIFQARVGDDPATALVTADLLPKTKYTVTVTGVLSAKQQPLVPDENTADFTTGSDAARK